ncbi:hypothetical protein RhiirC2_656701, partial [Rhizophagus irregularis]
KNSLVTLWRYLWGKWYCDKRWPLWVRSICEEKISILKITMFVKGYWKMVKFFQSCLNFVVYVLLTKVIPHQQ